MIEGLADLLLAFEAIKQCRIAFHLGMWNFNRDLAAISRVGTAKDRSHAAAGYKTFDSVMIQLVAGMERGH
jgi:hypothetical protein